MHACSIRAIRPADITVIKCWADVAVVVRKGCVVAGCRLSSSVRVLARMHARRGGGPSTTYEFFGLTPLGAMSVENCLQHSRGPGCTPYRICTSVHVCAPP